MVKNRNNRRKRRKGSWRIERKWRICGKREAITGKIERDREWRRRGESRGFERKDWRAGGGEGER